MRRPARNLFYSQNIRTARHDGTADPSFVPQGPGLVQQLQLWAVRGPFNRALQFIRFQLLVMQL